MGNDEMKREVVHCNVKQEWKGRMFSSLYSGHSAAVQITDSVEHYSSIHTGPASPKEQSIMQIPSGQSRCSLSYSTEWMFSELHTRFLFAALNWSSKKGNLMEKWKDKRFKNVYNSSLQCWRKWCF